METVFWGNRKRMNIKYFFFTILLLILNYVNLASFESFNLLAPLIWISLFSVGIILVWKSINVFTGDNIIEIISSSFNRLKLLMYVLIIVLMIMSLVLIRENRIYISGFDLLFFQRTIAIVLFIVTLMNLEVIRKIDEIKFKNIQDFTIEPNIEFYIPFKLEENSFYFINKTNDEKVIYNKIEVDDSYNYGLMAKELFKHQYLKTEDGLEQSTVRNFLNFIRGFKLDQKLIWLDTNPTGTKESTYTCLVLLLNNIIDTYKNSRSEFVKSRLVTNFTMRDFDINCGSINTAFSQKRIPKRDFQRVNLILEILSNSKK